MAQSPAEKRAARRRTAKYVRELREARKEHKPPPPSLLGKRITGASRRAQESYARDVLSGRVREPEKDSPEGKQLARMASLSKYGKADAAFQDAWAKFWYHDKDKEEYMEEAA